MNSISIVPVFVFKITIDSAVYGQKQFCSDIVYFLSAAYAQNEENNTGTIEIEMISICVQNFITFHQETKEPGITNV